MHPLSLCATMAGGVQLPVRVYEKTGYRVDFTPDAGAGKLCLGLGKTFWDGVPGTADTAILSARQPGREDAVRRVLAGDAATADTARHFVVLEISRVGGGVRVQLPWHATAMSQAWEALYAAMREELKDGFAAVSTVAGLGAPPASATAPGTATTAPSGNATADGRAQQTAKRLLGGGTAAGVYVTHSNCVMTFMLARRLWILTIPSSALDAITDYAGAMGFVKIRGGAVEVVAGQHSEPDESSTRQWIKLPDSTRLQTLITEASRLAEGRKQEDLADSSNSMVHRDRLYLLSILNGTCGCSQTDTLTIHGNKVTPPRVLGVDGPW